MEPGLFAGDLTRELGSRFELKSGQRTCVGRAAGLAKNCEGRTSQNR